MSPMLIPIIGFLVIGVIVVTYLYLRFRERQLMFEKGISFQEMAEFLKKKRNPVLWLKTGIVLVLFGLGLGFGIGLEDYGYGEFWIPMFIFGFTGLGFILSFFVGRKFESVE
ncbi:MAG: hypothetical protein K8F60_07125 [Melioribacteraceae bacterium]|mgnify:CR=1 FL=1|jgi:hypothetical protein|nr:hypothetical protein [Ignavibacteriota bacterium]MBZ0182212.1 hypothetical protein [Melioribacteraceae bacterium]|tara:strand:+ start:390 stop:725 length:336 start_codon:yes stop_codon:yes gene_type:complete